jgi:hypothetical protein
MKQILLMATMLLMSGFTRAQTIQSSNYATIGHIKDDGTVQNSNYATIGYAKGIDKEWAAVAFFFFRFN